MTLSAFHDSCSQFYILPTRHLLICGRSAILGDRHLMCRSMAASSVSSLVEKLLNQRQRNTALQKVIYYTFNINLQVNDECNYDVFQVSLFECGVGEAADCLVQLCQVYQNERRFSAHPLHETFKKVNLYKKQSWIILFCAVVLNPAAHQ